MSKKIYGFSNTKKVIKAIKSMYLNSKSMLASILVVALLITQIPFIVPATAVECWGEHIFVNGICTGDGCGEYQPATENSGVYEISNTGNLYWFAARVNEGNTSYNAKLMTDINLNPGYSFTFDPDTGLVTVTNGTNTGYLGTGIKGTSGGNTEFDTNAATRGRFYSSINSNSLTTMPFELRMWTPIGNYTNSYAGTFNGNGKTVRGMYSNGTSAYHVGLFGYIDGGTVSDLSVASSYIYANNHVGGVFGALNGTVTNCSNSASINGITRCLGGVGGYVYGGEVTKCYNTGPVNSGALVGGVCGGTNAGSTLTNCYNTGRVLGNDQFVGGVCGSNSGAITNCYNTGIVTGSKSNVGGVSGGNVGTASTVNCYYLVACASDGNGINQFGVGNGTQGSYTTDITGSTTGVSNMQFKKGEITYALNGGVNQVSPRVWYQNIDNGQAVDLTPKFTGGTVYCGYRNCDQTKAYSNSVLSTTLASHSFGEWSFSSDTEHSCTCTVCYRTITEDHIFDTFTFNSDGTHTPTCSVCDFVNTQATHAYANGFCTDAGCNEYQPATRNNNGTPENTTDDCYEIANPGQLFWFAEKVNSGETAIKGKLTFDIDLENRAWTPIGSSGTAAFRGVFDGNNHTISGLSISATGSYKGLFGAVVGENAMVCNLTVRGEMTITSPSYTISRFGGITGYADGGAKILKCTSYLNITVNDSSVGIIAYIGGICGTANSADIEQCAYYGNINLGDKNIDCAGGIVGYSAGSLLIKNCGYYGSITSEFENICFDDEFEFTVENPLKIGGISGCVDSFDFRGIINCFINGLFSLPLGCDHATGAITGFIGADINISGFANNYYFGDVEPWGLTSEQKPNNAATLTTASDIPSGKLCYQLNSGVTDGTQGWYQNIDNGQAVDSYPKFTGGTVYYGYINCDPTTLGASNTERLLTLPAHSYGEFISATDTVHSCMCSVCHKTFTEDHVFSDWTFDDEKHTSTCTICHSTVNQNHIFDTWAFNADGIHSPSCSVCSFVNTGVIHTSANGFCTEAGCNLRHPATLNNNGTTEDLTDDCYEIANGGQLFWFAEKVNSGETAIKGKLTSDINLESRAWTPIGSLDTTAFRGVFDGNNHTISGLNIIAAESNKGLFGSVVGENAMVCNLTVLGQMTITSPNYLEFGGIAGYADGGAKILKCTSCVNITVDSSLDNGIMFIGGICGRTISADIEQCAYYGNINLSNKNVYDIGGIVGRIEGATSIKNCGYYGSITSAYEGDSLNIGGILGNLSSSSFRGIKNCFSNGSFSVPEDKTGGLGAITGFVNSFANISGYANNYYFGTVGPWGSDSPQKPNSAATLTYASDISSGKLCYQLNNGVTDGTQSWYQNINNGQAVDSTPKFTGGTVYYGYENCDPEKEYSNSVMNDTLASHSYGEWSFSSDTEHSRRCTVCHRTFTEDHIFDTFTFNSDGTHSPSCSVCDFVNSGVIHTCANGFCTEASCNQFQPATRSNNGTTEDLTDDYYEIANGGQLFWFAEKVNAGDNYIKGKLTSDINLESRAWTPIGFLDTTAFRGVFDGDNHTVSGLSISTTGSHQGLFGSVSGWSTVVCNLTVRGQMTIESTTNTSSYFGGIVGFANMGTKIHKCTSYVNITVDNSADGTKACIGGICGFTSGSIEQCAYYGIINLINKYVKYTGGIVGYSTGPLLIKNCGYYGSITSAYEGDSLNIGGISGRTITLDNGGIKNCFSNGSFSVPEGKDSKLGAITGLIETSGNTSGYANNYYFGDVGPWGPNSGVTPNNAATLTTASDISSGKLCYLLNDGVTDGTQGWYQNIDNGQAVDSTPKFTGGTVYYINNAYTNYLTVINSVIDVTNNIIYTDVTHASDLTNIIAPGSGYTLNTTPSLAGANNSYCGTGTVVTVSHNGTVIATYTLIVNGDVNGDSVSDALDCMAADLVLGGHATPSAQEIKYYDADKDGTYTIADYQLIENYSVGIK